MLTRSNALRRHLARTAAAIALFVATSVLGPAAEISAAPPPARPNGLTALVATFGQPCTALAGSYQTVWPYGSWFGNGQSVTVSSHPLLAQHFNNALGWMYYAGATQSLVYGIGSYFCRPKNGMSDYSVHSWGAAIDTNTVWNPQGQNNWSGIGQNWVNWGNWVPAVWQDPSTVNFNWGLSWNDPQHFQYVTGY